MGQLERQQSSAGIVPVATPGLLVEVGGRPELVPRPKDVANGAQNPFGDQALARLRGSKRSVLVSNRQPEPPTIRRLHNAMGGSDPDRQWLLGVDVESCLDALEGDVILRSVRNRDRHCIGKPGTEEVMMIVKAPHPKALPSPVPGDRVGIDHRYELRKR